MFKLTDEEVRYNCILETQKSLIELGACQQKEITRIETTENRYKWLEDEISTNMTASILTLKIDEILTKRLQNDRRRELLNLFEIYNEFFVMHKDMLSNLSENMVKIEDDYNSLREENNETNKEYDEKQTYWETRVCTLRHKCLVRNKKIDEFTKIELYNTYNIIIKNCGLVVMCLFNFDITEFICDYFIFILAVMCYSFYINFQIIIRHTEEKVA